ncbi:DUF4265 domain-containing protein [Puteibacter caeruleilacunae]|nr:DUF4265 domain-containing protein [Puteibacter caeruleilacunae]
MQEKVLLLYEEGGSYKIESVWATKIGENYRIDNVPFFAKNIALDDIVSVENDNGELYFDSLIEASGNSVIQLVVFDESKVESVGAELVKLGCGWEGSHIKNLISVNIPKDKSYSDVKNFLEVGEKQKKWEYQEACLVFK